MPPTIRPQTPNQKVVPQSQIVKGDDSAQSAWDLVDTVRMLLYGQSGTGKTTFASTFPSPILWLICSGGNKPGELKSIDTEENRKRIKPKIVTSTELMGGYIEEGKNYATVVLDHASGLADLCIKELLGLDEIPISKYRKAGKGESWSLVSQQQYGQMAIQCKEYFRALLNLPGNIIIIAQERKFGGADETSNDSELMAPTISAALTPSLTGWLAPACDYVVQTYKRPRIKIVMQEMAGQKFEVEEREKGAEYCLRTGPHDVYQTKFRVPKGHKLPECIVDPDYSKFMAVLKGRK